MTDNQKNRLPQIPESEISLANLGLGEVAYVREMTAGDVENMIGQRVAPDPDTPMFCLHLADGTPVVCDSCSSRLYKASWSDSLEFGE